MNNENEFVKPQDRENHFKEVDERIDNEKNRTANDHIDSANKTSGTSPAGSTEDPGENLGGTTNLSLDQLKEDKENEA